MYCFLLKYSTQLRCMRIIYPFYFIYEEHESLEIQCSQAGEFIRKWIHGISCSQWKHFLLFIKQPPLLFFYLSIYIYLCILTRILTLYYFYFLLLSLVHFFFYFFIWTFLFFYQLTFLFIHFWKMGKFHLICESLIYIEIKWSFHAFFIYW